MKNGFLVTAILFCMAVILACKPSSSTPKATNSIIGKWKIDSLSSKDSNDFGALLIAMSLKERDNTNYDLQFSKDTLAFFQKDTIIKTAYQFYPDKNELFIVDDSTIFSLHALNDSLITLTSTDSVVLFLKKNE